MTPKPSRPRRKLKNRPFDLHGLRVLAVHATEAGEAITVVLSASDVLVVGVALSEARAIAALPDDALAREPVSEIDGQPALTVRTVSLPGGLTVGRSVNMTAILSSELVGDTYTITATATELRLRIERQSGASPITLPVIGMRPPITDEELGLDDALHVAHVVDHGIHRELRRLEAMPRRRESLDDDQLRRRIVRLVKGPSAPRRNGIPIGAVLKQFPDETGDRIRALLDEAVARGEIMALRRSVIRGVLAASVNLYAPKPPSAA